MNLPNNRHADPCKRCGDQPVINEFYPPEDEENHMVTIDCPTCCMTVCSPNLERALRVWNGPWKRTKAPDGEESSAAGHRKEEEGR